MSRYTSPEDARSDLFLSGAAYLFGSTLLALLFSITGIDRLPGLGTVLRFALPLITTVLVPVLLMRYRKESLGDLGLSGPDASVGPGMLAGLTIAAAAVGAALLATGSLAASLPLVNLGGAAGVVSLLVGLVEWLGLLFLAFYGTVKARDAFRGEPQDLDDAVVRIGRFVAIAGGVALVLLILAFLTSLGSGDVLALVVYPAGIAVAVAVALRSAHGSSTTTLPTVLTPVILLALGPFALQLNAAAFVVGIYNAALQGGIGLIVAVLVERTRRGAGVVALALVLGLGTQIAAAGAAAI